MQCDYFDSGACRSCVHLRTPYGAQLAAKDARVRDVLRGHPGLRWEPPQPSVEAGFRAKAKMVVAGTPDAPTLGILDAAGGGVDLKGCRLLGPGTAAAIPVLAAFVSQLGLRPYDVPRRTGELKGLHVIEDREDAGGSGTLMVRFVLRSEGQLGKVRASVPALLEDLPQLRVVTANLLAEHKAAAEGDVEIVLTAQATLPLRVGDVVLHVHPGAFVQTNTAVASALYRQAAQWIEAADPRSVLDLYCGVGGFALHAAGAAGAPGGPQAQTDAEGAGGRSVHGIEVSAAAVAGARRGAAEAALAATFDVGDATRGFDELIRTGRPLPDLVIVNPPRRGVGPRLAGLLQRSGVPTVVYSSCNPATLARDMTAMPSLRPARARLFDMFPHTDHAEVLTLLRRD